VFSGTYYRTIDNKGRVFVPSIFREDLVKGLMISKGYGLKCLCLFSIEKWEKIDEKIIENKVAEGDMQRFKRWFFGSAVKETVDQQGRIRIPQNLIEYAGLEKDIVMVGVSNRVEIWNKENWQEYDGVAESEYKKNPEVFEKLVL